MVSLEKIATNSLIEMALRSIAPAAEQVVRLDRSAGVNSRNFEYADLIKSDALGQDVGAIVEKDGSPLVYIATGRAGDNLGGRDLAQLLGNRGETAVLLDLHRSTDQRLMARAWPCDLEATVPRLLDLNNPIDARSVLGDLQQGLWGTAGKPYQEQRLRDLLVDSVHTVSAALLNATASHWRAKGRGQEVLALVGRALFTRFLLDRGILAENTAPELWALLGGDGSMAFNSAELASRTCEWLDNTFNGEFMPLGAKKGYHAYFSDLLRHSPGALAPLGWIVGRTDAGGQLPLWERLDFSHIPAGTLSEVYEDYARRKAPRKAKETSVHFTPRHIARMMVRQALAGLPENEASFAKILDPAVGAAVFLSLTFRELARLRAQRDNGHWPDTGKLREILYSQLCGMDFNADALNLAALTLYLTAIELDENPVPPEKLKFHQKLLGSVLFDMSVKDPNDPTAAILGSLRKNSLIPHDFDIVIGNPPWTSLGVDASPAALTEQVTAVATRCMAQRQVYIDGAYSHPDHVPDIAFAWKATEWAKPGAIISLIVHQRLLIKQSSSWRNARRALLSCIQVDGIIDGGEFANHAPLIWPGVEAPFCILFARNQRPPQGHETLLISLAVEPTLTQRRQIRIDPLTTIKISAADFDEEPGGLVARTKGCELDRALLKRWTERMKLTFTLPVDRLQVAELRRLPLTTIGKYMESSAFTTEAPKRGFKSGLKNTKLPVWFNKLPAEPKLLSATSSARYAGAVKPRDIIETFTPIPVRSSPKLRWYEPPMLLIRQAAGTKGSFARAVLIESSASKIPVLYPFAFLGSPLQNHTDALLAAKYVSVWVNSSLYSYYQTLTSTQFGFGIKALLNEDILDIPILPMQLALAAKVTDAGEIQALFDALSFPRSNLQQEIDSWVQRIMGMDNRERQLIDDTLSVSYPIGDARKSGKSWVSTTDMTRYVGQLKDDLQEGCDVIDVSSLRVVKTGEALAGWRFLTWTLAGETSEGTRLDLQDIDDASLLRLVREKYPQGEVWATASEGNFVFGQLALNRLWLPSRATLVAQVMVAWADECIA